MLHEFLLYCVQIMHPIRYMGNKPSDSSHMEGYSSALAVAAKQLQQANINKHIREINDNNHF